LLFFFFKILFGSFVLCRPQPRQRRREHRHKPQQKTTEHQRQKAGLSPRSGRLDPICFPPEPCPLAKGQVCIKSAGFRRSWLCRGQFVSSRQQGGLLVMGGAVGRFSRPCSKKVRVVCVEHPFASRMFGVPLGARLCVCVHAHGSCCRLGPRDRSRGPRDMKLRG
jgi:hypothetical protein